MGYWQRIIVGAWDKTRNPLGWDRKKFAFALLSVGTVIATGFHFGWLAMIESASGVLWLAFPPAFAGLVLFIWGIVETQAQLYANLAQTSGERIAGLETRVRHYETHAPNYAAVRLQHQYALGPASRLWCDIDPNANQTMDTQAWYGTFVSAIQRGRLRINEAGKNRYEIEQATTNPNWSTTVTREEFKRYAASINEDPTFLRDS